MLSPQLDPELTRPEISNRLVIVFLGYFEQRFGRDLVDRVLAAAGLPREHVANPEGWCSTRWVHRFAAAVARELEGATGSPAYDHPVWQHWRRVGQLTFRPENLGPLYHVAQAIGSPAAVLRQMPREIMRGNRTIEVSVLAHGPRSTTLQVSPRGSSKDWSRSACWNLRGALEAVPGIWGLPNATVELRQCMHDRLRPADSCVYQVRTAIRPAAQVLKVLIGVGTGATLSGLLALIFGAEGAQIGLAALTGSNLGLAMALQQRLKRTERELREEGQHLGRALEAADERYAALWEEGQKLRRALAASRKLSDYLPENLVEQILEDPEPDRRLGGRNTEAAVLFADLVGFTRRCEPMAPEQVVEELNLYFSHVDRAFTRHGGVIDKRMGDGVMAVFVPRVGVDGREVRRRAVLSGLDLLRELEACNQELARRGVAPLNARVGVASGKLVQGTMGSPARLEYTVIGDTVNLAARLEGQATPGHLLTTTDTWAAFDRPPPGCILAGRSIIMVKGKADAIDVVELAPELLPQLEIEDDITCEGELTASAAR